jgi:hypothetical protein
MAAPFAPVAGVNGKLYWNTADADAPIWSLVSNVRDVEIPLDFTDVDISGRYGGGWKQHEPALADLSLSLTMLYDPYNIHMTAFIFAGLNKLPIELLNLDAGGA